MKHSYSDTPETLNELRRNVHDWLLKSEESLLSFQRGYMHFWKNTDYASTLLSTINEIINLIPSDENVDLIEKRNGLVNILNSSNDSKASEIETLIGHIIGLIKCINTRSNRDLEILKTDLLNIINTTDKNRLRLSVTNSRSYSALVYANIAKLNSNEVKLIPKWANSFFCTISEIQNRNQDRNFEYLHHFDFVYVYNYLKRFYDKSLNNLNNSEKDNIEKNIKEIENSFEYLKNMFFEENSSRNVNNFNLEGKMAFEKRPINQENEWIGHHFFTTLHFLRSATILNEDEDKRTPFCRNVHDNIIPEVMDFCIKQCFYICNDIQHKLDITSLAFAGTIYCLYARQICNELCDSIIDALYTNQLANGTWPATHPIVSNDKHTWHIASHEIALCLTWIYFQPHIKDESRSKLLEMMNRYFEKCVINTYTKDKFNEIVFSGWKDDHNMSSSDKKIDGWATAIVCHFLSNYIGVLNDHINKCVIESLNIQASSENYLVTGNLPGSSKKWCKPIQKDGYEYYKRAIWFDLPPFNWDDKIDDPKKHVLNKLKEKWTDPSHESRHSESLAEKVIAPILRSPSGIPVKNLCSGILSGNPGTRKTTLVKTIAESLEWPLVTVPASVIFDKGFDLMETRGNEVFRRLNYLTKCVIFFDEFEEFFRSRIDKNNAEIIQIHNRTIAAFTTPAMLPRLQDLHDKGQCLIFFATNHPEKVDKAIKRPGRFDFQIEIGHPDRDRIKECLDVLIDKKQEYILNIIPKSICTEAIKNIITNCINGKYFTCSSNQKNEIMFLHIEKGIDKAIELINECSTPDKIVENKVEQNTIDYIIKIVMNSNSSPPHLQDI